MGFFISKFSITILFFSYIFSIHSLANDDYAYPYKSPYVATLTAALMKADDQDPTIPRNFLETIIKPERNSIPLMEERGALLYNLSPQPVAAPLIFILSGLGGHSSAGYSAFLTDMFYKQGFHVLTISSPFFWNFALSASSSGLPGLTFDDAADVYKAMQLCLEDARARYNVKTKKIGFIGVSLGALEGAYISVLDQKNSTFSIDKYLLINPPVELEYGIQKLVDMRNLAIELGLERAEKVKDRVIGFGMQALKEDIKNPQYFMNLDSRLPLSDKEAKFVIGAAMQDFLGDTIFVSQQIKDLGILKTPATKSQMYKRLREAKKFSLLDYLNLFLLPTLGNKDKDGMPSKNPPATNFINIAQVIKEDKRVFLMHNEDDFLINPSHIELLKETFGPERSQFFPRGGHVGNLWYPENKKIVLEHFQLFLEN